MWKKIYYVDAFTTAIFGGNPAGVVIVDEFLHRDLMQKMAKELNLSETVFIKVDRENPTTVETRFFTPVTEVELCGHATLAAFYVLVQEGYIQEKGPRFHVKQITLQGELSVEIIKTQGDIEVIMDQQQPQLVSEKIDGKRLSRIMGIEEQDIGITEHKGFKGELKPGIASTGLKDLIVPLKSLEILKKITIDEEKLKTYSEELGVVGIHAFTLETLRGNTAHTRNFAPLVGISEEAATGTANGALGYYLVKNKLVNLTDEQEISLSFEQGDFMERSSEIQCYIRKSEEGYRIKVGGKARICIKGEIQLPENS
ncbi:PhzF family phenazine biosynthesis protein [Isachenkonia alkalipeptolytica]|uniref:PhzF family phenazine biosynthesis protein n=1 Tax=Isachenkonia alkalipeptolytica TaxID=2565777 RepID=A0AA43XM35_9CLOT|nr:PhzF family phenazine biosynthesis protein [Isachenkonia alkalipeptolytica]